ncbi:helix-turn-helix transcriptional regulator [Actinophytocola sediminis]
MPPAVMKILLGRRLEEQRKQTGLTQDEAAKVLRCTQQKIAYIENGGGVKYLELRGLLDAYHSNDADRAYAEDLHQESNRRAKRGGFRSRFRQHLRLLVDLEPTSQRYFSHQAKLVPGLLQTEDYMRALFRAWRPSLSRDQIDQDTEDRLGRQRILDNVDQRFWFIFDEAALRRTTGSQEIMRAQIHCLVDIIDRPNVDIQVVPFDIGYYMGQAHSYYLFGYDTTPPVDIVYLEQHDGGEYVDENKRTAKYQTLWEQQRAAAMGPEQTRRYLLDLVRSL